MTCPYCGKEMTSGLLCATGAAAPAWVYWISKAYEQAHAFPPVSVKKIKESGGFQIFGGFGLSTPADAFYLCRACGKLIGDLPRLSDKEAT